MHWYYQRLEKTQNGYVYKYSTENNALDGLIECDLKSGDMWVVRPSEADKDSEYRQGRAMRSFYYVIRENFPEERHVCCG